MRHGCTSLTMACLALVACTSPVTQRPFVSPDEIRAEQALQRDAAMVNPFPPIVEPVKPTKGMKNRLQKTAARINPQASKLCYDIRGGVEEDRSCNFSLEISGERGVNAYADGQKVVITSAMMEFAQQETHLAFVLAHELSHNIMEHQRHQGNNVIIGAVLGTLADVAAGTQGANTQGGFGKLGANVAMVTYSPAFEQEADYVGLYILARAGYPIEQAPNFWRAMSQYEPQGIYARTSHPTNAERFVAMNKTINEIRGKQRAHQPLIPNIRVAS